MQFCRVPCKFGQRFQQSLDNVQLPSGLHTLTVGCSVARVLPSGLHTLTLGDQFNQSLDSMILPSSLHKLTLGRDFNQSLHKKSLPCGLQMLTFGHFCDQDIRNAILPSSLQNLTLGCCFNQSVDGMSLPPNLQVLTFGILVSIRVWQGVQCQAVFRHLRFALHSSRVLSLLSCLLDFKHLNIGEDYWHGFHNLNLSCHLIVNVARHFEAQHGYAI